MLTKSFDAERKKKKELKKGDKKGDTKMEKRSLELPEPDRFVRGVNNFNIENNYLYAVHNSFDFFFHKDI